MTIKEALTQILDYAESEGTAGGIVNEITKVTLPTALIAEARKALAEEPEPEKYAG